MYDPSPPPPPPHLLVLSNIVGAGEMAKIGENWRKLAKVCVSVLFRSFFARYLPKFHRAIVLFFRQILDKIRQNFAQYSLPNGTL